MAVYFLTTQPKALLSDFKKKIDQGHVETWSYDQEGDFTHSVDQWRYKAWLRPSIESNRLAFYIIKNTKLTLTPAVYGIYHGRLIESLVTHCDKLFTEGIATAMPEPKDGV
jgi:hypothetical protein